MANIPNSMKTDKAGDALIVLKDLCDHVKSDLSEIYSLVFGHSQFIPILLSTNSDEKKLHLLSLVLTMLKRQPKLCSSLQVPIYLGAYNATLSKCDQLLIDILRVHELEGSVSFQAFKPMVWGQAAISKFSVLSQSKQTSKTLKVSEILALFHPEKMFQSALNFPNTFTKEFDSGELYDPRFVLPLLCQLCSPQRFVDKHLKLIESGGLAMALASLSCRLDHLRQMGLVALQRMYDQLQGAKKSLSAEKQIWLHLLDLVRHGLVKVCGEKDLLPRLPHITTSFLVHMTKILSNPLDTMYKSISQFILAKPVMDLFTVPEFLRLFHSSNVTHYTTEQEWVLNVIARGIKDELDYSILQQNFIPKMLMSFYDCQLCKSSVSDLILDIFVALCQLPSVASDLVRNHGFLFWLKQKEYKLQMGTILRSLVTLKWSSQYQHELLHVTMGFVKMTSKSSTAPQLFSILRDTLVKMEDKKRLLTVMHDQIWTPAVSLQNDDVDQVLVDIFQLPEK